MRTLTRLEANKEARRVLVRSGVDLSYAQYSVSGREIRLTGWLCHQDSSNFNANQVEIIIQNCTRALPGYLIAGDFENWKFSSDYITRIDTTSKNPTGSYHETDEDIEKYDTDVEFGVA